MRSTSGLADQWFRTLDDTGPRKDHRPAAESGHGPADVVAKATRIALPLGVHLMRRPGGRPRGLMPDEGGQERRDVPPVMRGGTSDLLHGVRTALTRPPRLATLHDPKAGVD